MALDTILRDGAMELWIDLTETAFMDSTSLPANVAAREQACALQRRLAVICPPGGVRRVFDMAGIGKQVQVFDGRDAAQRAG